MHIPIHSVSDLGMVVRAVRRNSEVRIDDLAATAGVSKQFVSDVEYGKPTVRLGLVLKLLAELGVPLTLDIPQDAESELNALRAKAGAHPADSTNAQPRRRPGTKKPTPPVGS